jgi:hypothetical protein
MTTTNNNAPPYVVGQPCDRYRGTHAEGDAETGERMPCTRCFGLSPRPAPPLDLDAIEARATFYAASPWDGAEMSADDVPALVARVRHLEAKLGAAAQAYDDLVAQVWRATGEEHEPPADVAALLRRVGDLAAMVAAADRRVAVECARLGWL